MHEDFLHHVWKYQKFKTENGLKTNQGEDLHIISTGQHNQQKSGPDFFNAKIIIGHQIWAGNVEIHINASDWYAHHHEEDPAYDNVILHVVWEDDVEVFRKDQNIIPSFSLKEYVLPETHENYRRLVGIPSKQINCEKDFVKFDDFTLSNWVERLYIERLEEKSNLIFHLLEQSKNNWEDVFFKLIAKNFGLNRNGEAFLKTAEQIPHKLIAKHHQSLKTLESFLLGTARLLNIDTEEKYILDLQKEYDFLKHKYQLKTTPILPQHFRLRPDNFPEIRLAQLAKIYHKTPQVFQEVLKLKSKEEFYNFFEIRLDSFWDTHYSLTKISKKKVKNISKSFIDLLIINTIIPLKFCFEKQQSTPDFDALINLMSSLKPEQNRKVKIFENLRKNTNNSALSSQALLQLKTKYCDKNYCLKCHLGQKLINQSI